MMARVPSRGLLVALLWLGLAGRVDAASAGEMVVERVVVADSVGLTAARAQGPVDVVGVVPLVAGLSTAIRNALGKSRSGKPRESLSVIDDVIDQLEGGGVQSLVMRFRDGMFTETITPVMLKAVAHVRLGECGIARLLFDGIERELRGTPGTVYGEHGLRTLRRTCGS
jgi:hypothetical protein